jgi:hypothetical protein
MWQVNEVSCSELSADGIALSADVREIMFVTRSLLVSFGTDSHGPEQLRCIAFAMASDLQAGIALDHIVNLCLARSF